MATIFSGAIEAGVTAPDEFIAQLSQLGVGDRPWGLQLANVGTAQVTAALGHTATGPWTTVVDADGADAIQRSDMMGGWYLRIKVVTGTTLPGFEANLLG